MTFTVVIPAYQRPQTLARCLRALPPEAAIIVSDDSRDDTIRELIAREFPSVRWTPGPRRGPAANRNPGASLAATEWIAFIDDDCEPQTGWLSALERSAADADVIEGLTLAPGATDSPFEEHVENPQGGNLWSCNLAVRRDVFQKLNGFDEDFLVAGGEDMEFAWRVQHTGLRVRFAPAALVHHPPRFMGWRGLWRRTWMIHWSRLFLLKTGQSRPLPAAALQECIDLLRVTAQLVARPDRRHPKRHLFAVCWRWLTFPLVLPYTLYWDWRFRRLLASRTPRR